MTRSSKTVTRKGSAMKPVRQAVPRERKNWNYRDHLPELALPFVEYLGPEARGTPRDYCNYWSVPDDGPTHYTFSDFLLGRQYALMAAKFVAAQQGSASGEHLLLTIFDAMAKKRCFDLSCQDKRSHHVAHGFVEQITELLQFAAKHVRELPVVHPLEPDVPGPAFSVRMPDGSTLVCNPQAPIAHKTRVAITRAGQFLGQGVVETKHPTRAKTLVVKMDGVSPPLHSPGDIDRADLAPIIGTQAPGAWYPGRDRQAAA